MPRYLLLFTLMAAVLSAQTTGTATIVGAVTDPTGAVIAGAKVTVVNVDSGFVANSVTTPEGTYYVPYLIPGPIASRSKRPGSSNTCGTASCCAPTKRRAST